MTRRSALLALSGFLALAATAAQAQDFPARPITLVVPYAPGGTTDILGRAFALSMSKTLKQTVIVENKAGAGGTLGLLDMRNAKPDGYRLSLIPVSVFRQPYVQKVQYDPVGDLTYVASFSAYDFILGVAADSPYKTLQDVVADARKSPGDVNYGTPGRNTGNHVAGALLARAADVKLTHVPFKGDSEAINALLAGHIKVAILTNGILNFMEAGKVRALAVAADRRPAAFAKIPTFKEAGYDVVIPSPLGIAGPKGLPQPIVEKLDAAVKAALDDPEVKKTMATYGVRSDYRDHKAYAAFAREMFAREKDIVTGLGLSE
ncbi:tripartite tricarboxylate transporter substrate binding protein [Ottowia sp.]|uniref:tripartite tricarboxylate transporter substrate binding protein n=1 Tax=Ottowia sp. TaxID=1898956 RepID=UPI0039E6CB24